jgi:hypothetical protein
MLASEFIEKNCGEGGVVVGKSKGFIISIDKLKKLDSRFKDVEELKEKIEYTINECSKEWKLTEVKQISGFDSYKVTAIDFMRLKREILKLLSEE